jgi:hypothetical protein
MPPDLGLVSQGSVANPSKQMGSSSMARLPARIVFWSQFTERLRTAGANWVCAHENRGLI